MEYKILMLLGLALIALLGCVELWMEKERIKKESSLLFGQLQNDKAGLQKQLDLLHSVCSEKSRKLVELQGRCDALRNQVFNLHKCLNEQQGSVINSITFTEGRDRPERDL